MAAKPGETESSVRGIAGQADRAEVTLRPMAMLLHEMSRAARLTPLEIRTRWHAARAARLDRLARAHRADLDECMVRVQQFVDCQ